MQFRKEALARVQTQEALDLPVRLTSPHDWIVLAVLAVVVVAAGAWGATATLPRTVVLDGLITSARGSFPVQTTVAGQVVKVFVQQGAQVAAGARVVRISTEGSQVVVRAPAAGRIFSLSARVGQVVDRGSTLAVAEYAGTADDRPVAVLYVPAGAAQTVDVGSRVAATVESVPVASYGTLRGRVGSVDSFLSSRRDIEEYLGDQDLAEELAGNGPARRIVVELAPESGTVSGYAWSTRSGPPFPVRFRSAVQAKIQLPGIRPMEWFLPKK